MLVHVAVSIGRYTGVVGNVGCGKDRNQTDAKGNG